MKIAIFANTDWYLFNFRRNFALALVDAGFDVLLLSPPGEYVPQLKALGLRWISIPMRRRSLNPVRELGLLWRLTKLLKRERVDLIHGFTIKCAIYGSLAGRLAGVPARVNAVAGMGFVFVNDGAKARLLRPIVRYLMRHAMGGSSVRLVLQNSDDADFFRRQQIVAPKCIRVIRSSGVDCGSFYPSSDRIPRDSISVLLAARLLWEKGLNEYVRAAQLLRESGRQVRFFLAGASDPGNPNSVDEASVNEWTEAGIVEWLGQVEDMPSLLRSVDIVVLPSYYGEGLPKSLIEAAASGCALVTTDMPGCREAIIPETTGILVPARDSEALAAAIARLYDEPELRARMGVAARRDALARFDERIVIEQTLEVYQELLNCGPDSKPPFFGNNYS